MRIIFNNHIIILES